MAHRRSAEFLRGSDRTWSRPTTAPAHDHPVLRLQGQVGNRAVTTLVRRSGADVSTLGPVGNRATTALLLHGGQAAGPSGSRLLVPVQRQATQVQEREAARITQETNAQVNALPDADANVLPAAANVQDAVGEANAAREDLARLGVENRPVADAVNDGIQVPDVPNVGQVAEELAAAEANPQLGPPRPRFFARAGTAIKGFASRVRSGASAAGAAIGRGASAAGAAIGRGASAAGAAIGRGASAAGTAIWSGASAAGTAIWSGASAAGTAIKGALTSRETRRDVGAKSPVAGSIASVAGTHLDYVTSAASSTSPTLEHPGEVARSFTSGAFELTYQIASVVGTFFSALKAALDLRSLVSSVRVIRALKEAKREAEASGADPDVVKAVDYAISQKYEKVIKRAIGASTALAALGVALAILVANPVGASLAAIIIGGVGASVFVYKIGRWATKKWATESLGKKRAEMARALHERLMARDARAVEAVRALHLDPEVVIAAFNGPDLIARKLKSS